MEILLKLFLTFLKIGLVSIGGGYAVIPSIHEEVVVKAGWIGEKVFADIITISQMTPGPLAVNTSTFVGLQIAGAAGAVVATVGCVFCGVAISLTLYRFFQKHKESVYIFESGRFYAISHILKKIFLFVKFWRVSFVLSIGRWMDDVALYGR